MAKKRISAEERKEFKGGKYMGGPAEEKAEKKKGGKRMAMGGSAGVSDMMYRGPESMPGQKPGRGMPGVEPGGNGMGRPMRPPGRGRPSFLGIGRPGRGNVTNYPGIEGPGEGSMGRNPIGAKPPSMGRPTTGGELPPMRNMGPDRVDANAAPGVGMGASTGLTPVGGGIMTPNMNRDPSAVSAPRTMKRGGLARKGKTMAKGGLVKGSGCAARGVKKPRYT